MRFLRILPEVWARIVWSLSSFTRNIALGSSSDTTPVNSIRSSLAIRPPAGENVKKAAGKWAPDASKSTVAGVDRGVDRLADARVRQSGLLTGPGLPYTSRRCERPGDGRTSTNED